MTPVEVVAELSANHLGSLERAKALVDAAKAAGASAVKLQTWAPGKMVLPPASEQTLQQGPWAGRTVGRLYEEALLPWDDQAEVFAHAKATGIECFASVFDPESLAFLESLGCPRYKIASFELVDLPLISCVASTGKPLILSTGMARLDEIHAAVGAAQQLGCTELTLLKCTSAYPAPASSFDLASLGYLRRHFGTRVGLSDHSLGMAAALLAASLGATMIEKHFTLNREAGGLDAAFSIEPPELARLVRELPDATDALGQVRFGAREEERSQLALRRSLYFTRALYAGEVIRAADLRTARPALGLEPRHFARVVGQPIQRAVKPGEPVRLDVLPIPVQVSLR